MYSVFEALLKQRKIKVSDVSKATGISPSTFSDWKSGRYALKQDKLLLIADYFGVSVDFLLTGNDKTWKNGLALSYEEENIIRAYREQSEDRKDAICLLLGVKRDLPSLKDKEA